MTILCGQAVKFKKIGHQRQWGQRTVAQYDQHFSSSLLQPKQALPPPATPFLLMTA
jgi:hypothetical protein